MQSAVNKFQLEDNTFAWSTIEGGKWLSETQSKRDTHQ